MVSNLCKLKISSYNVKEQIEIIEFYNSIERFIISTKRNFQWQNNFKKFRILMASLFARLLFVG